VEKRAMGRCIGRKYVGMLVPHTLR